MNDNLKKFILPICLEAHIVYGQSLSWLARAISVTLEDHQMLVQRGALELLLSAFPIEKG